MNSVSSLQIMSAEKVCPQSVCGQCAVARRTCGGRGGPPGVVSIQRKALSLFLAWVSAINLTSINISPPHVRRTGRARGGRGGPPGVVSIQSKALSLCSARVRRTRRGHGGPPGVVSIQSKALSLSSARVRRTRRTTRCSFHSKQGTQSVLRARAEDTEDHQV